MKIVESIKGVLQRFKAPSSKEDVSMNKCDLTIVVLISFILLYGLFIMIRPIRGSKSDSIASVPNKKNVPSVVVKDTGKFEVGDIVGVKYLNVYGIVTEKILSFGGYKYEVTYKSTDRAIQKIELEKWMLFRPTDEDIKNYLLGN